MCSPHCEALRSFEIPYGADEIGSFTFEYCSSLESLVIPDTVKKISHRAVLSCTSLKEIFIPDSVEKIAALCTFERCESLSKVRLPLSCVFFDPFKDEPADDKAAECFYECHELHTVEMCGREFRIDKMCDEALLLIRAELAADGSDEALKMVLPKFSELFTVLVNEDLPEIADGLLARLSQEDVSRDDLLAAIDYAAVTGAHQVYLPLMRFAGLGEDPGPDEIRKRFEL